MSSSSEVLEAVGELAAGQWGLVTAAQARAVGVGPRRLARLAEVGALERVRHGVYRVSGAPGDQYDELRAAWLALDPTRTVGQRVAEPDVQVVSHRSAAWLHGLGDLDVSYLEFSSPVRKQSRDGQVRIHRRHLSTHEWTRVQGLPVTTVAVTIQDLAAARIDGGHLAGVVRDAVTTYHLDVAVVARALAPFAHHYGAPLGQGAVLLRRLLIEAGVPESTQVAALLTDGHDPSGLSDTARKVVDAAARMSASASLFAAPAAPALDADLHLPLDTARLNAMVRQFAADTAAYRELVSSLAGIDINHLEQLRQAVETNTAALRAAGVLAEDTGRSYDPPNKSDRDTDDASAESSRGEQA
jgi:hypothetical protein